MAEEISSYYNTRLLDGSTCRVLYYFWVMQAVCPSCHNPVDLFLQLRICQGTHTPGAILSSKWYAPRCSSLSIRHYGVSQTNCSECTHSFDASSGPARGKNAVCTHCQHEFTIGHTIRQSGSPPFYRMYAKLVLTPNGNKEYHPVNEYDHALYRDAADALARSPHPFPLETIDHGYNTNQVLNYGFQSWSQMFNARQLLSISTLIARIKEIEDHSLRDAFTCLLSGVLEFNNMFASYKGEGTGAVRHMFHHHILKPERTPLEANIWGTPKSSGSFSTLFRSRLLRAAQYAQQPFELSLSVKESKVTSSKVAGINKPLTGINNSESYEEFCLDPRLYVSCGDSAVTDLPDECVDLVVTDPPFFDNVHYSELADFFFVWQKLILDDSRIHQTNTTRSMAEVQNQDAIAFSERLTLVLQESNRVLRESGLLVFTYHHSRQEGWESVLKSVERAGFRIEICHPVKAELSVATPKHQAKEPINFDIIMVCRKRPPRPVDGSAMENLTLGSALNRAEAQIDRLQTTGWKLSRNDIGIVVMGQVVAEISRWADNHRSGQVIEENKDLISRTIDRLHSWHS